MLQKQVDGAEGYRTCRRLHSAGISVLFTDEIPAEKTVSGNAMFTNPQLAPSPTK